MNQNIVLQQEYISRIEYLEKEILKLKKGEGKGFFKKPISLKGIIKGVKISVKEIETAKESLFRKIKM